MLKVIYFAIEIFYKECVYNPTEAYEKTILHTEFLWTDYQL